MEFAQISRVKTFQVCQKTLLMFFWSGFSCKLKLLVTSLLAFIVLCRINHKTWFEFLINYKINI